MIALALAALPPVLLVLWRISRRRSGHRPITYMTLPVPGRLRHTKRGSKL